MTDTLQKFMFEDTPVRGELVELSDTWREILSRRDYPRPVRALLGEMLAAAALLSANLKFNGALVMQIHGDGPLHLLVVECDAELKMRATAKLAPDAVVADDITLTELVNRNGNGRFAITLDPKDKLPGQQPYQGIVPLDGGSVAVIIENYMMRSEQLDTRMWLAADDQVSRGLLLQKLPTQGGVGAPSSDDALEAWDRTVMLASTLRPDELLSTDIQTVMRRLFWEETIRVFDPLSPAFHCTCNRERVGNMLKMLGQEEVEAAIAEVGHLAIDCDFCGQHYDFDKVDCAQLFAADTTLDALQTPGPSRH
ncbi:Hsp33 family molecular chaperone HslO [Noviherbaspirillum sp. 1P10PC]|uniref:Hsp33 family molecular chaperone HslO n=1 Tax=Noviherbaspirillum sp. 1P10PC TaxID=3132292 RepID=UPI0039A07D08